VAIERGANTADAVVPSASAPVDVMVASAGGYGKKKGKGVSKGHKSVHGKHGKDGYKSNKWGKKKKKYAKSHFSKHGKKKKGFHEGKRPT
jgi:hypothetical protein